jgi:hypothetical protein
MISRFVKFASLAAALTMTGAAFAQGIDNPAQGPNGNGPDWNGYPPRGYGFYHHGPGSKRHYNDERRYRGYSHGE